MTQITDILAHLRMDMMTDMFVNDIFIIMHFLVQNIIEIVRVVDKGFVYTAKSIPRLLTTEDAMGQGISSPGIYPLVWEYLSFCTKEVKLNIGM